MALRVLVKGDCGGDYELFSHDAHKKRINDTEILEMYDIQGNLLYIVPVFNMILFEDVEDNAQHLPIVSKKKYNTVVHVGYDRNVEDILIECDKITNDRFINSTLIQTHSFKGVEERTNNEIWVRTHTIPIENIRFINFRNVVTYDKEYNYDVPQNIDMNYAEEIDNDYTDDYQTNPSKNKSAKYIQQEPVNNTNQQAVRVKRPTNVRR